MAFWRRDDKGKKKAKRASAAAWASYIREINLINERLELGARRQSQNTSSRTVGGLQNTIGGASAIDALAADYQVLAPRNQRARKVSFKIEPVLPTVTPDQMKLIDSINSGALSGLSVMRIGGMR
jgi:hypothetical protein